MKKHRYWLAIVSLGCTFSGCALCCSPYDEDYMSVGGKHQRTDMVRGRMGSVLSDPNLRPQELEAMDGEHVEYVDAEYSEGEYIDEESDVQFDDQE